MTNPEVNKEMIVKFMRDHEEALRKLRACKLWQSMGETYMASANELHDFPNTRKTALHQADIMHRSLNRVYRSYCEDWNEG